MSLPFSVGKQLGNIVVAQAGTKAQRAGIRAIRLRYLGVEQFVETDAEGLVDHFFKGLAQSSRAALCLSRDIWIESQCGSHRGIMMSMSQESRWKEKNNGFHG